MLPAPLKMPQVPQASKSPFREVRAYILFGTAVIATLVGGIGVWAASVDLAGAVLASGNVVVERQGGPHASRHNVADVLMQCS